MKRLYTILLLLIAISPEAHSQSVIDTVMISETSLDTTQAKRYHWFKDSLSKYSNVYFCRMHMDSTSIDTLGNFTVSLPSILGQDLVFTVTFNQLCYQGELDMVNPNLEGVYYQGELFHDPSTNADTLLNYASFRFLQSSTTNFLGYLTIESDKYEVVDLGNDLQLLCKVSDTYYHDLIDTCSFQASTEASPAGTPPCINRVRILCIYTTQAMKDMGAWQGSLSLNSNVSAHTWSCIGDMNAILTNSGANFQVDLASIQFLDIGESGNSYNDLHGVLPNSTTIDGWRAQYRADVVVQFTGDYAGILGDTKGFAATADYAFSIVEPQEAATDLHVFSHEVGHQFGCMHESDPNYLARGYYFKTGTSALGLGGKKRATVMSVKWQEHRIPHYSNPNVNFMGVASGTSTRNSILYGLSYYYPIIRDFYSEQNVSIRFERINCTNYRDYWYAEGTDICLDTKCTPLTFEWYKVDLLGYFFALNFSLLGTGNAVWINLPYNNSHNAFILMLVKDCNGDVVFSNCKILQGWDASGNCVNYRTIRTNIEEYSKEPSMIVPNPSSGGFAVQDVAQIDSFQIFDELGRNVKDNFFMERINEREYSFKAKTSIANGAYYLKLETNVGTIGKIVIIRQ